MFADEVGAPSQKCRIKLQTLSTELGDALSERATRPSEVVAVPLGIPGPEMDALRRLKVVVHAKSRQRPVLGGRDEAKPCRRVVAIALPQVVACLREVTGDSEVIGLLLQRLREWQQPGRC